MKIPNANRNYLAARSAGDLVAIDFDYNQYPAGTYFIITESLNPKGVMVSKLQPLPNAERISA